MLILTARAAAPARALTRRPARALRLAGCSASAWLLWTGGDLYWTLVLYDLEEIPIPSPADAGYLLAILPLRLHRARPARPLAPAPRARARCGSTASSPRSPPPRSAPPSSSAAVATGVDRHARRGPDEPRLPGRRPRPAGRHRRRRRAAPLAPGPHLGPARRRRRWRSGSPTRCTWSRTPTAPTTRARLVRRRLEPRRTCCGPARRGCPSAAPRRRSRRGDLRVVVMPHALRARQPRRCSAARRCRATATRWPRCSPTLSLLAVFGAPRASPTA